jgi:hypothetical protein
MSLQLGGPGTRNTYRGNPGDIQIEVSGLENDKDHKVEVVGLIPEYLDWLEAQEYELVNWRVVMAINVLNEIGEPIDEPVDGQYRLTENSIEFRPTFPFLAGSKYRASFIRERIIVDGVAAGPMSFDFEITRPDAAAPTTVTAVFPSADLLPENQLRMYVVFSAPMTKGHAGEFIKLLNDAGESMPHPFLIVGEELWNPQGTRLTLILDPARVKQGILPREQEGPVLEQGRSYTLVVHADWLDATGRPLAEEHRKPFQVGPPDVVCPDPALWTLTPPKAETAGPLAVRFPEPLDRGMLERVLGVQNSAGEFVPGRIEVTEGETVWQFTPDAPWGQGAYVLEIDTALEDLAANSIASPFEVDVFKVDPPQTAPQFARLSFEVVP